MIIILLSAWFLLTLDINRAIICGGVASILIGIVLVINLIICFPYLITSGIIFLFIKIIKLSLLCILNAFLLISNRRLNVEEEALIKRTVLDLGTKFSRLDVKEISEKCKVDKGTIVKVVKNMVGNQEIYAEYFKSSNSVSFNQ
jgi:hypothetical protein